MNKKAALSLSITAIVVIVIAFVVLGLGLSLTAGIFDEANKQTASILDITKIANSPTSDNPITIGKEVRIARNEQIKMELGFYNKGQGNAVAATFDVASCLKVGGESVTAENLPSITSSSVDVGPSEVAGYSIIMQENGLTSGTYICHIGLKCGLDSGCPAWAKDVAGKKFYDTKDFFLEVDV